MVADCGLRHAIATNVGGGLRQAFSQMQFTERGFQSRSRQSHNLQIAIGSLQIRIGSLHLCPFELIGLYSGKSVARFLDSFFSSHTHVFSLFLLLLRRADTKFCWFFGK